MQFRQIANELVKSEADVEDFKKDTEKHQKAAEEAARKRLVNFFIAKAINEAEKIQVEQAEIDAQIRGISAAYGYKEKDLRQQMENSGGFEELHMDLTIAKASQFIVDNADFGAKKSEKAPEKKKETKNEKKTEKKEPKKK
jgi:FKBP-type peptidyl-prolyl cis-trans isomerase (trigger factor)